MVNQVQRRREKKRNKKKKKNKNKKKILVETSSIGIIHPFFFSFTYA